MTALLFAGVRKTFGATTALHGLDLEVEAGELICLLGPSGCGKTTALRIAAGFERADTGSVTLGDVDITNTPPHRRNMGMVFQSYSLFPNLTVALNVDFGLRTRKLGRSERSRKVTEMLELVQLGELANRYPHQLSGGQQQRVALARALAVQPDVLLLDEPLSALDAKVRLTLRDEIRRIQSTLGITTLLVTHDQEEALAISDRVGVMSQGHLEQLGTPMEVYRNPASAFVARFVGSMNEMAATAVDRRSVQVGGTVVATEAAHEQPEGSAVTLLVRPEDLSVCPEDPCAIPGTVVDRTFQGAGTVLTVRLDVVDSLVTVHLSGNSAGHLIPGDRTAVLVDGRAAVYEVPD